MPSNGNPPDPSASGSLKLTLCREKFAKRASN